MINAKRGALPRPRLHYLDSLRGVAALYVVAGHALGAVPRDQLLTWGRHLACLLDYGGLAVAVFIVLSGYCLMLPSARDGQHRLRGGMGAYVLRRARRIYPPYLAALGLSLILLAVASTPLQRRVPWLSQMLPAFSAGNLLAHLAMVHNLSNDWLFKINPPFWSVATEWQIYFVFPLVLLPIARVAGIGWTVPAGLALGLLPILLLHRFEKAAPWFCGLFAMGMWAAVLAHSPQRRFEFWRERLRGCWGGCAVAAWAALGVGLGGTLRWEPILGWQYTCASEVLCGVAFSLTLLWLAEGRPSAARQRLTDLLHARPLRGVGAMSYSLYLTHAIPVCGVAAALSFAGPALHGDARLLVAETASLLAALALAAGFYFLFERPFVGRSPISTHTVVEFVDPIHPLRPEMLDLQPLPVRAGSVDTLVG